MYFTICKKSKFSSAAAVKMLELHSSRFLFTLCTVNNIAWKTVQNPM